MKLKRLLALSSSAVIAAACSSGGSSVAPHAAATAAGSGPTATKHAANAKLTIKFPPNFVRLKKPTKTAGSKARTPAFLDPGSDDDYNYLLAIEVASYGSNTEGTPITYMAATAASIGSSSQIPIYLAPGNDLITVQEYEEGASYMLSAPGTPLVSSHQGYLLAQGQVNYDVDQASQLNLSVPMQMVLGTYLENVTATSSDGGATEYAPSAGLAIVTDANYDSLGIDGYNAYFSTSFSNATSNPMCVESGTTLYFLPVDDAYGTENPFEQGVGYGNVTPGQGLPFIQISSTSAAMGTIPGSSSLSSQSPLGFYEPAFDGEDDDINVQATFPSEVLVDPKPFGPFTGLAAGTGFTTIDTPSSPTYYLTLADSDSANCDHLTAIARKKPGTSAVRKPPHKT